jgi:hypothetical protein
MNMNISSVRPPSWDNNPLPSSDTQKCKDIIDTHYKSVPANTPVGCNLVVMRPGVEPICLNAGNLPLDAPQHWGSVSKQFTAACIAKLVDQGKIDWKDDIRKIFPELPEFKYASETQVVTIDDLAHMSSGLSELGIWAAFSDNEKVMLSVDERKELLAHCPELLFKPGSQKMYCNDNYFLMADIVAKVSGKTFIDFVREEIFEPLQMSARCCDDPTSQKSVEGYDSNLHRDSFNGSAWGAFGVVGRPSDMVKWNEFLGKDKGKGLTAPPSDISVPKGESVYCRGLKEAQTDDYRVVYHMGSINGFCTRFMRYEHHDDPSKTFAFFISTNTNDIDLVLDASEEIAKALGGKSTLIKRDELSEVTPPPLSIKGTLDIATNYEGTYESPILGLKYKIEAKDDLGVPKLYFSLLQIDGGSHVIVDLVPTIDKDGEIVYRGPAADWIELTSDGIVLKSPKMAPIVFNRILK